MSRTTCLWEADLAAVALDALPLHEEPAVRRHAVACPACDRALAEFEEAAAVLGSAVAQVGPPRRLKRKLLLRLAAAYGTANRYVQEAQS